MFFGVFCFLAPRVALGVQNEKIPKATHKPKESFKDIIATYNFVGDLTQKEETREVSEEIFWKYPLKPPGIDFPIEYPDPPKFDEFPKTVGEGKPYDHMNRGRIYFLAGDNENAKLTWLGGKKRYGNGYEHHRRNDYFIGSAFLNLAKIALMNSPNAYQDTLVKGIYDASSAFLSFSFVVKEQDPTQKRDELIEKIMPKGLYNLSAIYWKYGRFAGAFGAADSGLNYLRKTGRSDYRSQLLRIVAESHIKNRSYLEAIQNLDQSIRQDSVPEQAAASFSRAGDIYFDLNNYELAEDVYNLAAIIDNDLGLVNAAQLVLRGESLFWLGKFSESQKVLHFALESPARRKNQEILPKEMAAWAALRFADGYLARHEYDKARLEYYKVRSEYRSYLPGRIAKVRESCLNLPYYTGKNVAHARVDIEESKADPELPSALVELGWACQVGSYTSRERTSEMLERVRKFSLAYPESKFLDSFIIPVTSFQSSKLQKYIEAGDFYAATEFYEKNKQLLFKHLDPSLGLALFKGYAYTKRSVQAMSFWRFLPVQPDNEGDLLLRMAVLVEAIESESVSIKHRKTWSGYLDKLKGAAKVHTWSSEFDASLWSFIDRIKLSKNGLSHSFWILKVYEKWSKNDQNLKCDAVFPIISASYDAIKSGQNLGVSVQEIRLYLADLINSQMPDLFKNDESCAVSLIDLEAKLDQSQPEATFKKILSRSEWPMVGGYLSFIWTMSEIFIGKGMQSEANQLWRILAERAPESSVESRFSRQRLDAGKTEFERLWEN